MKRICILLFSLCLTGLVAANDETYPPISPDNVMNLREVELLGNGAMNDAVAWLPDGRMVVGGTRGLYVYESLEREPTFIELDLNIQSLLFAGDILFFTDDTRLYAYDLANQVTLYALEGQKPLAVSHDGQLLAYEVDMGVQVLAIASAELVYNLSYEGILEAESTPQDDWFSRNRFYFAQFSPDGTQLVLRWNSSYAASWEGRFEARTDIWLLADASRIEARDSLDGISYWDFVALDQNGDLFGVADTGLIRAGTEISLEGLSRDTNLDFDTIEDGGYALHGNLFAAPYRADDQSYTGLWDIYTGQQIAAIPKQGEIVFNPTGDKIAIDTEIYAVSSGERLRHLQSDNYEFYQDNILQYGADDRLWLLDPNNFAEIAVLPMLRSELGGMAGDMLIHQNRQLAIWIDPVTGEEIRRFTAPSPLFNYWESWRFNHEQSLALSVHYNNSSEISLWDVATGSLVLSDEFKIFAYEFFAGDYLLVSYATGIGMYNPSNQSFLWTLDFAAADFIDAIWLNEEFLLVVTSGETWVYDRVSLELIRRVDTPVNSYYLDFLGDKLAYVAESGEITVLALRDGAILFTLQSENYEGFRFHNATTLVIEELWTYNYIYYDLGTGQIIPAAVTTVPVLALAETDALQFFGGNGGIRIENSAGERLHFIALDPYYQVKLSRDTSRILVDHNDGVIALWAVSN